MITLRPSLIISLPMRLTLFTAITWLLGGCVASVHSTKIDTSKPLDPNNGVVAVQVVNNAERLSGLNSNWTSVIVIRLDTIEERKEEAREKLLSAGKSVPSDEELEWNPDYYPLSSQFSGTKDSRIFLGMMPEGEYMISRLFSVERIGNMTSTVSMPVGYTTGKFMVEKARFTDLGTLLFQPLLNIKDESFWSSGTSFRAYVTRTSGSLELDQLVQLVHPKLKSSVDFESPLTWQKDGIDEFRQKVAKISQDNLYGSEFTALGHHAKGVLPTRLGRVRVLNSNSEWTPLELPTQSQILTALDTPELIAFGGECGLLFISDSLTGDWKVMQPIGPDYAIVWLGKFENQFAALAKKDKEYELYRFASFESDWELIKKHSLMIGSRESDGDVFPLVTEGNLRLIFLGQVWDYDTEQNTWSKMKGNKFLKLSQLNDDILVGVEDSSWIGVGDQVVSFDAGLSWQAINRELAMIDNRLSLPAISTKGNLITVSRKPAVVVEAGESDDVNEDANILRVVVIEGNDVTNMNAWNYHGEVQKECASIIPEISSENRIYMLCDKGQLLYTDDLGASWHTDISIDIVQMQKSFDDLIVGLRKSGN